jgi:8-oxo-dGTP diphosphatase
MSKSEVSSSSVRTELPSAIVAAGGIILGRDDTNGKVAVVRRPRYGSELSLPKGKLKDGESEAEGAVREVYEETGCRAKIRQYAGSTHYAVRGVPKIVFYFIMDLEQDDGTGPVDKKEVEAVDWITIQHAQSTLTHREERDLIRATFCHARR